MADGTFEIVGPKLNVFALANGMDLERDDPRRRVLSWYRDGRERAIVIEANEGGTLRVSAASWKTHQEETRVTKPVEDGVAEAELAASLSGRLERAIETANALE